LPDLALISYVVVNSVGLHAFLFGIFKRVNLRQRIGISGGSSIESKMADKFRLNSIGDRARENIIRERRLEWKELEAAKSRRIEWRAISLLSLTKGTQLAVSTG